MKFSSSTVLLPFLLLFFLPPLQSANVYIVFNDNCMDRLEYAYGFTPQGQEYVKYNVQISPTEALIFEVGPENNAPKQNYLSGTPLDCGDPRINKELVYSQRGNTDEVFIVRQVDGGQYQVSKVNASSYFRRDAKGVQYDSWQMTFNHLGGLKEGDNLTPNNATGVNVLYQGVKPYDCTQAYVFKQTYDFDPNAYRERYFIPSIGIVEDRSVPGGADGIYKLRRVNAEPFEDYLQQICQSGNTLNSDFLNTGTGGTPVAAADPLTYQGPAFHEVERGETLFSISRTYGVSVDELRTWNQMDNSTMLKAGDRLRVLPPESANDNTQVAGVPATAPQESGFSWGGEQPAASTSSDIQPFTPANSSPSGGIQPFSPGGSVPAPNTATKGGDLKPWEATSGTHTVSSGETPALLALRYGYTEDRFRYMNGLGPNDILKVGQEVKTSDCPTPASSPFNSGLTPKSGTTAPAPGASSLPSGSFNYNSSPSITGNTPTVPATNVPVQDQSPGKGTLPGPPTSTQAPPPVNPGSNTPHFEPYGGSSNPDFSNLSSDPFSNSSANSSLYPNTDSQSNQPAAAPPAGSAPATGTTLPTYNNAGTPTSPQPTTPNQIQPYSPGGATPQPETNNPAQPNPFGTPLSPAGTSTQPSSPTLQTNPTNNNSLPTTPQPQSYNTSSNYTPYTPPANTDIAPYTPPADAASTTTASSSYKTTHVVREGETLDSIAKKYNTDTQTLRQINNLNANEILIPYQKLYIN